MRDIAASGMLLRASRNRVKGPRKTCDLCLGWCIRVTYYDFHAETIMLILRSI